MQWWPETWAPILVPDAPIAELIVRVSAIYLFLWIFLRLMPTRQLGRIGITDVLFMLLLAVSVRHGLTGHYFTLGDAVISATVLIAWDRLLTAISYHVGPLRSLMRQEPVPVVEDGRIVKKNARRELLTEGDIMEKLRERGYDALKEIRRAYVEPDGRISVIPLRSEDEDTTRRGRTTR